MDTFETVRSDALRLHTELVNESTNPLQPLRLAEAAVTKLDLELHWLPVGDPLLKHARAVFDAQSGSICCEDIGSAGERAILVAHEIGHARIHGASPSHCTSHDIDPSESTEAAPVGLQRVEAYGVRERRELQANVFAREFLMPRPLALDLYLGRKWAAERIATETSLRKDIITQQLLDGLLLPVGVESDQPKKPVPVLPPDASQAVAASHRGCAFQVEAGPGTGKTRTLVDRVLGLLSEGVDPAAILILTFSNRAAGELAERIGDVAATAIPRLWMGTFHAFGLDFIRRHHDKLGLPSDPMLFDRTDTIEILEEILPTLPLVYYRNLWDPVMVLRDIVATISRAKDELHSPASYLDLALRMQSRAADHESKEAAAKSLEVAKVYELYEQALSSRGAVDFGDLVMKPAVILERDQSLRAAVQLRHRHVLVDEYQDVNRASARLLKHIAGDGGRLWVVGDSRQSIYRFRGASSANMALFNSDYPQAQRAPLKNNYRSTTEIVNTFVGFSSEMAASKGMLPLTLNAHRGSTGIRPEIRRYDGLDLEADGIAASVEELRSLGVPYRKQAILCRSNSRLSEIASTLETHGIPVLHLGSLFERDEIRDLLALLSITVDRFGSGLVRVGSWPRYNIPLQDVFRATQYAREADQKPIKAFEDPSRVAGLSDGGADGLLRLMRDLQGCASMSGWELLTTYLLDRTDLLRQLAEGSSVNDKMKAIAVWQFLNFVRERLPGGGTGSPIYRILERVRRLVLLAEERDLRQIPSGALQIDAVRLMTVHGSKGLEFEAVHIPGLTVSSFPASYQGQRCPPPDGMIATTSPGLTAQEEFKQLHNDEEECLFFVALSRAKTFLRLYLSRRAPGGGKRTPSPYLQRIEWTVNEMCNPAYSSIQNRAVTDVTVHWHEDALITDGSLLLYDRCPRRFFYAHVLRLAAGSRRTGFSQTHNCLYKLIKWVSQQRLVSEPTLKATEDEFERIWIEEGPTDHAYAREYRSLSSHVIRSLLASGTGRKFRPNLPLSVDLPHGHISVQADEIAEAGDGSVILRRIRTGKRRSDEEDHLTYTLYHLAAQANFGRASGVEAVYLTDGFVEPIAVSAKKLASRREKSDAMLVNIGTGQFPAMPSQIVCPRCPYFFICPATPHGTLSLR